MEEIHENINLMQEWYEKNLSVKVFCFDFL